MADNFVDLYQPQKMLAALVQTPTPKKFFHQIFFRNTVLHETKTVQFDLYKGKRKIAAYVNPLHDGILVERDGYETHETEPAYVKEIRALRPKDTQIRLIGETPYNGRTPRDRAAMILGLDLAELETRLARLEEKMCAEALLTGKVIVNGKGFNAQVDFRYEDGVNKITLSGTSAWNDTVNSDPMKDIDDWRRMIVKRCGIQPTHCIVGSEAAWAIINNEKVQKRLDNTRYRMGEIKPENLPEGVSYYGELLLPSGTVSLYSYDEWYTDATTGDDVPLMPPGKVLLGSTNARCEFHYGMIQNIYSLQAAARFPLSWTKDDGAARFVQLESAPMPNIFQVDAFIVADVLDEE
jgi:hypothetical protein